MDEIIKELEENKELTEKLKGMWKSGAEPGAIADAMVEAGIEVSAEKVEAALSELQVARAKTIGAQALDDGELDQVAGGGAGICDYTADCDDQFLGPGKALKKELRCILDYLCDEYLS